MKITEQVQFRTTFVNPISNLDRPLVKILKKGLPFMEEDHLKSGKWLAWKDKLLKALDGQRIGFPKAHFYHKTSNRWHRSDLEPGCLGYGQTFISNICFLQIKKVFMHNLEVWICTTSSGLNAYLLEFPPDKIGQETALLPVDESMDIIYNSLFITWVEQNNFTRVQLRWLYCQRNEWFFWNNRIELGTQTRRE